MFADRKAGALMAVDSALLAVIYPLIRKGETTSQIVVAIISSILLTVGISVGFAVIRPRGRQNRSRGRGVIDADRIAQFENAEAYTTAVSTMSPDAVIEEIQVLTYDYSWIDRQKYKWLRLMVPISGAGAVSALLTYFWRF